MGVPQNTYVPLWDRMEGEWLHSKKKFSIFMSPAGTTLTKLSLGGNYDVIYKLFLPRESLVSDIPAGDGNIKKLFLRCMDSGPTNRKLFPLHGQVDRAVSFTVHICTEINVRVF